MLNIIHKGEGGKYNYTLNETSVNQVSHRAVFKRASVIPYFVKDGVKYYALFLDSRYRELTDSGGTVKKGEDYLDTALRELKEESLGILDLTSFKEHIGGCKCYHDHERITIFVETTKKSLFEQSSLMYIIEYQERVSKYFDGNPTNLNTLENCSLLWLNDSQITKACNGSMQQINPNNYITYINTLFYEYALKRMSEIKEPPESPLIRLGFTRKKGSNIEYAPVAISKSKMTPYWFFKIYIEPHHSIITTLPGIWSPILYFFRTILSSKGELV